MGFFDKKFCDICGDKIGLLGNRKLENGNCCKNCAAKLSPWFSDRRNSTVEEIKAQLEYREQNKEAVAAFHPTKKYGEGTKKLLIDEQSCKFTIAAESELKNGNPDILELADISGVQQDIDESSQELKRKDKDGKYVSYVPAKYKYSYNFNIQISVRHPYIDDMSFRLNPNSVELERRAVARLRTGIFSEYGKYMTLTEEVCKVIETAMEKASAADSPIVEEPANTTPASSTPVTPASTPVTPVAAVPAASAVSAVNDNQASVSAVASDFKYEDNTAPAASAGGSWICPCCTAPNTGSVCEYCGTPKP